MPTLYDLDTKIQLRVRRTGFDAHADRDSARTERDAAGAADVQETGRRSAMAATDALGGAEPFGAPATGRRRSLGVGRRLLSSCLPSVARGFEPRRCVRVRRRRLSSRLRQPGRASSAGGMWQRSDVHDHESPGGTAGQMTPITDADKAGLPGPGLSLSGGSVSAATLVRYGSDATTPRIRRAGA